MGILLNRVRYTGKCCREDAEYLDGILSDESFRSLRILRVRARVAKPMEFPRLEVRNIKVEFSDSENNLLV